MANFPLSWLNFKCFELDVQKLPGLCLMKDEPGETETERRE